MSRRDRAAARERRSEASAAGGSSGRGAGGVRKPDPPWIVRRTGAPDELPAPGSSRASKSSAVELREGEREEEGDPSGEDEAVLPSSPDGKLERLRERNGLLVQCMARRERLGVRETRKYSGRGQVGLEGRGAGFGTAPSWKNRRFAASSFSSDMLRAQGRAQRSALGPRSRGEGGGGEGEGRTGATCSAAWP